MTSEDVKYRRYMDHFYVDIFLIRHFACDLFLFVSQKEKKISDLHYD